MRLVGACWESWPDTLPSRNRSSPVSLLDYPDDHICMIALPRLHLDLDVPGLELPGGPGEHAVSHLAKIDGLGLGAAPDRLPVGRDVRVGGHEVHSGAAAPRDLRPAAHRCLGTGR